MQPTATIGVTGLSAMGRNLARNIARHGHTVAVHNRTRAKMTSLLAAHGDEGDLVGCESLEDFVAAIETPRAVIVMVKAGVPTDAVIDALTPLLDQGDIVIDAGNARFTDTLRREKALSDQGIHFVKMMHNGIEYADMQLIAESFDLLRSVAGLDPAAIADVFRDTASETPSKVDRDQFVDDVQAALYASKVVAYAQGFDQLAAGSREYDWDLDLGTVATISRGCIIRARFLDRIKEAYATEPDHTSLLTAEYVADTVSSGVEAWRRIVGVAHLVGRRPRRDAGGLTDQPVACSSGALTR